MEPVPGKHPNSPASMPITFLSGDCQEATRVPWKAVPCISPVRSWVISRWARSRGLSVFFYTRVARIVPAYCIGARPGIRLSGNSPGWDSVILKCLGRALRGSRTARTPDPLPLHRVESLYNRLTIGVRIRKSVASKGVARKGGTGCQRAIGLSVLTRTRMDRG